LQQALLVVQLLGVVFAVWVIFKQAQHGTADLLIVEQGVLRAFSDGLLVPVSATFVGHF
jgi:hypothetical protein